MSEWISVKDRLPEERKDVLAYFSEAGYYVTSWFKWDTMPEPLWSPAIPAWGKVTHWMSLPEPPAMSDRVWFLMRKAEREPDLLRKAAILQQAEGWRRREAREKEARHGTCPEAR
jgi:hypothetical protein